MDKHFLPPILVLIALSNFPMGHAGLMDLLMGSTEIQADLGSKQVFRRSPMTPPPPPPNTSYDYSSYPSYGYPPYGYPPYPYPPSSPPPPPPPPANYSQPPYGYPPYAYPGSPYGYPYPSPYAYPYPSSASYNYTSSDGSSGSDKKGKDGTNLQSEGHPDLLSLFDTKGQMLNMKGLESGNVLDLAGLHGHLRNDGNVLELGSLNGDDNILEILRLSGNGGVLGLTEKGGLLGLTEHGGLLDLSGGKGGLLGLNNVLDGNSRGLNLVEVLAGGNVLNSKGNHAQDILEIALAQQASKNNLNKGSTSLDSIRLKALVNELQAAKIMEEAKQAQMLEVLLSQSKSNSHNSIQNQDLLELIVAGQQNKVAQSHSTPFKSLQSVDVVELVQNSKQRPQNFKTANLDEIELVDVLQNTNINNNAKQIVMEEIKRKDSPVFASNSPKQTESVVEVEVQTNE